MYVYIFATLRINSFSETHINVIINVLSKKLTLGTWRRKATHNLQNGCRNLL